MAFRRGPHYQGSVASTFAVNKTPIEWENEHLLQLDEFERTFESRMEPWLAGNVLFANRPYSDQVNICSYITERRNYLNLYDNVSSWFLARNLHRYSDRLRDLKGKFDELIPLMFSPVMRASYQPFLPPPRPMPLRPAAPLAPAAFNADMARIMRGMQEAERIHQENMYQMQKKITGSINSFPT